MFCSVLVLWLWCWLHQQFVLCRHLPGLGSPKPRWEAPGAAWRTAAGRGTADLNLMRTMTLSRTRQIQVGGAAGATYRTQPKKHPSNRFVSRLFQVLAGRQISGTKGPQRPKPQQGGTALLWVAAKHRKLAGPTSLSSSLSPGEKQTCWSEF